MGTKNNSLIMDIFLVHVKHFQRAFRIIFLIDRKSIGTNRPQKALFLGPNSVFSSKLICGPRRQRIGLEGVFLSFANCVRKTVRVGIVWYVPL